MLLQQSQQGSVLLSELLTGLLLVECTSTKTPVGVHACMCFFFFSFFSRNPWGTLKVGHVFFSLKKHRNRTGTFLQRLENSGKINLLLFLCFQWGFFHIKEEKTSLCQYSSFRQIDQKMFLKYRNKFSR